MSSLGTSGLGVFICTKPRWATRSWPNAARYYGGLRVRLRRILQRLTHRLGIARDHLEIGAGGLIGFSGALFPISEGAERNLKPSGKLFLREAKRTPDDLGTRRSLHALEVVRRQWLRVGVGQSGCQYLLVGHWADGLTRLAHVWLLVLLKSGGGDAPVAYRPQRAECLAPCRGW